MAAYRFLLLLSCAILLSACASMNHPATHRGLCNTLKSRVIFSGATTDTREAEIQSASEQLEAHDLDAHCDNAPQR